MNYSAGNDGPIRSELLTGASLAARAEALAREHQGKDIKARGRPLLSKLEDNRRVLEECYKEIISAVREERSITPAAEWLIDNDHLVRAQIQDIRDHLPSSYYAGLPKLSDGPLAGYPRVYAIAWEFVAHTDSRFESELLRSFIVAYQGVQPLTMGELWAIPITLRLILIENLRRIAARMTLAQRSRHEADLIANEVLGLTEEPPRPLADLIKILESRPFDHSFAVELLQRLRFQDSRFHPVLEWIDRRFARDRLAPDEVVSREHADQAAANVSVRNIITSTRSMSSFSWQDFFEDVSLVEGVMRTNRSYAAADFPTRDRYRHAIEELAEHSERLEVQIAQLVVERSRLRGEGADPRMRDLGYDLISSGRPDLEKQIGFRPTLFRRLVRAYQNHALFTYLSSIAILTIAIVSSIGLDHGFAIFALFPAFDIALAVVNRGTARLIGPHHLPRLSLENGLDPEMRTLVAVPTLFTDESRIDDQIEALEIHHLSNPDSEIFFALLSDGADSDVEWTEKDARLLAKAAEKLTALNRKYGPHESGFDRFFVLHRRRKFNARDRRWLGWERKRGKLEELNRLLLGATDTSFMTPERKAPRLPPNVKYVITLDADTRLPNGAALQLIGALAHPLNKAEFDRERRRVVQGYGILQPRVTPVLPIREDSTPFQKYSTGRNGIDPYASAVSDVYQDLFGEGSFSGKGIYEVAVFDEAMKGRVPENALLSHDLFESCYARCGFLSDVEVFEEFPSHTLVAAARNHRWMRGDWQLLPWICGPRGKDLSNLSKWKMIDNLRRSLTAPAMLLLAILSVSRYEASGWFSLILAALGIPFFFTLLEGLWPRRGVSWGREARAALEDINVGFQRWVMNIVLLADQAWVAADAITRAVWRTFFSHRKMLEWTTAAQAKAAAGRRPSDFIRGMWPATLTGFALIVVICADGFENAVFTLPVAIGWMLSPGYALWCSEPPEELEEQKLHPEDVAFLRQQARRIWHFFDTFVTEKEHHLPPDNVQEDPLPALAHRTSPTNCGLYLLSVIAARDFGWIGLDEMIQRLHLTLDSMERLPRYQGHFYNWYETTEARALDPKYISSVDNGNLAGHLLAVAEGCRDWKTHARPAISSQKDVLFIFRAALDDVKDLKNIAPIEHELQLLTAAIDNHSPPEDRLVSARRLYDLVLGVTEEERDGRFETLKTWARAFIAEFESVARDDEPQERRNHDLEEIAQQCERIFWSMDFGLLYDPSRRLLSIGYRVTDESLDPSCYDLLASEARLASFLAVAKGDLPAAHWFRLGRGLVTVPNGAVLASWSGSMFEYLMPTLVMADPERSLIDESCRKSVQRQIQYGHQRNVPWGISEAAYNKRDLQLTYQYSNFGVPGLGLKRGLASNLVVAPYATFLAAMFTPAAAVTNLRRLDSMGATGLYGFYESLDFTPQRLPEGEPYVVIRAFMAHHQGMSLISLVNLLENQCMRRRFHADPLVKATDLLLQERTPVNVGVDDPGHRAPDVELVHEESGHSTRVYHNVDRPVPNTQLLSNGSYSLMVTSSGSGYSRWMDTAVTRWREDVTKDDRGSFIYLKDLSSGEVWSAGHQPVGADADFYEVMMAEDRVKIRRDDGKIGCETEILVSPEDNAEVRRIRVTNNDAIVRKIEVTSYSEIVLAPQNADVAHPAFSNLFVQTESLPELDALLANRRPRSAKDTPPWAAHLVVRDRHAEGSVQFDTDRSTFIGRGRSVRRPIAMESGSDLAGRAGSVLDPIFSLRTTLHLEPGASCHLTFYTLVAPSRDDAIRLVEKLRNESSFNRIDDLAWTQAHVKLHYYNMEPSEGHLYQRLAARLIFLDHSLRAPSEMIARCERDVTGLWSQGISGDLPIVLVRIDDIDDRGLVRQLLKSHAYLSSKGLAFDLVILNDQETSYAQDLQNSLISMVYTSRVATASEQSQGKVFVIRSDLLDDKDRVLLHAMARVILSSRFGSLGEQIRRTQFLTEKKVSEERRRTGLASTLEKPPTLPALEFFNGTGGFADDGREYVIVLKDRQQTPAPWINVLSNGFFGCQVSELGYGSTWSVNSRENQLTPWSNDPVTDPPGEAIYLRDLESNHVWSPTPAPIRHPKGTYCIRHGQGYSKFQYSVHDIETDLTQFVPLDQPVKISRLRIKNLSKRSRRLSVTAYVEWVLGFSRDQMALTTVTESDPATGAMFACNSRSNEFGTRIAFFDLLNRPKKMTGDRSEFIGRNGDLEAPAALFRTRPLSGKVGGGLDPCGALQTDFELAPGEQTDVVILLGQAETRDQARQILNTLQTSSIHALFENAVDWWDQILGKVEVKTPDRSMDLMLNRWLLYQTTVCRFWGRTAFYQAGGAYGFRDQLQDVMALAISRPDFARTHILRAAARQFVEGDVQHWWHPPSGRGVRTHFSDDLIWLPYVVSHYLETTGDESLLSEPVKFLTGPLLSPEQEDSYFTPSESRESASLFEHCARALDARLSVGRHGLPLIGCGDWNDGMNRVGHEGQGESVWMAWFLILNLKQFAEVAKKRGENERAEKWLQHAEALRTAVEAEAWDGDWYRRAYFDDGTPLGSATSDECKIDSLTQTWAVLSGAADPARATHAMESVEKHLVKEQDRMILLFTPPFDKTPLDPGYIRGYLPGVRENGGQYTHAAIWCLTAQVALGNGQRAWELFDLLNPISHAKTAAQKNLYKVEPYVLAADVYSQETHRGRGGWTWYTGSCGWMYRAGLEFILGFRLRGGDLHFQPSYPAAWPGYKITYRHGRTVYEFDVSRGPVGKNEVFALVDDGGHHQITVVVPDAPATSHDSGRKR